MKDWRDEMNVARFWELDVIAVQVAAEKLPPPTETQVCMLAVLRAVNSEYRSVSVAVMVKLELSKPTKAYTRCVRPVVLIWDGAMFWQGRPDAAAAW